MVQRFISRSLRLIIAALACYGLTRQLDPWMMVLLWAITMAAACGTAAWLLKTSGVGNITWKNRVAGLLLPFGYAAGRGKLWPIVLTSWLVWVLVAVAVALQTDQRIASTSTTPDATPSRAWAIVLMVAWAIDGAALLYVIGTAVKNFTPGSRSGITLIKISAVIVGIIAGSIILHITGHTRSAAILAGAPPAALAVLYGAFVGIMVTVGRNARWN
ncbi:MAG: hypothetical protein H7144_02855 [Burkholderiales bacterium]|nr:hypothetical protein [Phycisphaerae bacterium]